MRSKWPYFFNYISIRLNACIYRERWRVDRKSHVYIYREMKSSYQGRKSAISFTKKKILLHWPPTWMHTSTDSRWGMKKYHVEGRYLSATVFTIFVSTMNSWSEPWNWHFTFHVFNFLSVLGWISLAVQNLFSNSFIQIYFLRNNNSTP